MRRFACVVLLICLVVTVFAVNSGIAQQLPRVPTTPIRTLPRLALQLELPPLHQWIAEHHAASFSALPGFERVQVDSVFPIYDMKGEQLVYYEVKYRAPNGQDAGYAILSATEEDLPVVEFAHHGVTHFERFSKEVDGPFRLIRYGSGYIVAENEKGQLVGEIGFRPQVIPREIWEEFSHIEEGEMAQKPGARPVPLKEEPEVPELRIPQEFIREMPYEQWKATIDPRTFVRAEPEDIRWHWEQVREQYKRAEGPGNPRIAYASSGNCAYDYYWADGIGNMPYILQMSANTSANHTSCASGCGPTAWVNLYSWHRRSFQFATGYDSSRYNTAWLDDRTMGVRSYLGTFRLRCNGFTWHYRMRRGISYAESRFNLDVYYWWRWSLSTWWRSSRANWVFEVAREMARYRRPFIVGYYSDWHYAIGYGIAECRTHGWSRHSWAYIYPAWRANNTQDKWIPKSDIFGIWGIYSFVRR